MFLGLESRESRSAALGELPSTCSLGPHSASSRPRPVPRCAGGHGQGDPSPLSFCFKSHRFSVTKGTHVRHRKPERRESMREARPTRASAGRTQRATPGSGRPSRRQLVTRPRLLPRVGRRTGHRRARQETRRRGLRGRKLLPVCSEPLSVSSYVKSEKETKGVNPVGHSGLRKASPALEAQSDGHAQAERPAGTEQGRGAREQPPPRGHCPC